MGTLKDCLSGWNICHFKLFKSLFHRCFLFFFIYLWIHWWAGLKSLLGREWPAGLQLNSPALGCAAAHFAPLLLIKYEAWAPLFSPSSSFWHRDHIEKHVSGKDMWCVKIYDFDETISWNCSLQQKKNLLVLHSGNLNFANETEQRDDQTVRQQLRISTSRLVQCSLVFFYRRSHFSRH